MDSPRQNRHAETRLGGHNGRWREERRDSNGFMPAGYGLIVVESLKVKGLASSRLPKSVLRAGGSASLHKLAAGEY